MKGLTGTGGTPSAVACEDDDATDEVATSGSPIFRSIAQHRRRSYSNSDADVAEPAFISPVVE